MSGRYVILDAGRRVYAGPSWRRARAIFTARATADLVIDGYLVARRVDGARVRLVPHRVTP